MWGLRLAVIFATLATAFPAAAEDKDAARKAYSEGTRYYNLSQYADALEAFKRAYWSYEDPSFLYNIAQAYRLSKRPDKALSFYQKYLRLSPEAKNRDEVERHIAALKEIVEKQKSAAEAPPPNALPPPSTPPPPSGGTVAPTPTSEAPPPRTDLVAQPAEKPVYKKAWFWGVMGGVAAVVAAGVVVGVVYGTKSNVQTLQDARF